MNGKKMKRNIPWNLITRRFRNEISTDEQTILDKWLVDPENKVMFLELQSLWLSIIKEGTGYVSNADVLWARMEQRMKKREPFVKFRRTTLRWYSGVAAVLLFLLLFSGAYVMAEWQKASSVVLTYSSLNGKSKVVLPDGSHVWLNAGSTLDYSTSMWTKTRRAKLKGEAYFEVSKDPKRLFVVNGGGVDVKVYGTCFNMDAREKSKNVSVSLLSGSVMVENSGVSKRIKPGEMATCSKNEPGITVESSDVAFSSMWAKESVHFEKLSIYELIPLLSKWYGVKILLDPLIPKDQAYTFSITHEPLEEILRLMARINPIQYSFDEDNVVSIKNSNIKK